MSLPEAASKVSEETRAALPTIEWPAIGMRHRLVHAYFDVDSDVVWTSVNHRLPGLMQRLDDAIGAG
ncbi:DUF86 domain-containing protein [Piscinibacter sakaiensis]|uniref:HepT-like ribonuclease domain-containing protein n=1 Tax=Piscinibacter sakaiensis TaxID=1547922 RepID=UPI003AAD2710